MAKFEYCSLSRCTEEDGKIESLKNLLGTENDELIELENKPAYVLLNELGQRGWELVSVINDDSGMIFYFKRQTQ